MGEVESAVAAARDIPCLTCGACCVTFRVSFYNRELDGAPGGWVPSKLAEPVTPVRAVMCGTGLDPPRCVALRGEVGEAVSCSIYELRPTPCREFGPKSAQGLGDKDCNQARSIHGLPLLPE